MSAMKQGTPAWQKVSASTCRVTVLPVPVAPAMRPWRFAIFPTMEMGPFAEWATYSPRSLSSMSICFYDISKDRKELPK